MKLYASRNIKENVYAKNQNRFSPFNYKIADWITITSCMSCLNVCSE